jgi:hypothetical protein
LLLFAVRQDYTGYIVGSHVQLHTRCASIEAFLGISGWLACYVATGSAVCRRCTSVLPVDRELQARPRVVQQIADAVNAFSWCHEARSQIAAGERAANSTGPQGEGWTGGMRGGRFREGRPCTGDHMQVQSSTSRAL